jgi:hypothetical protein
MNQQTNNHRLPFIRLDDEHNRLRVHDYDSSEAIPSFSGLARDYFVGRFVLVSTFPGFETEINYREPRKTPNARLTSDKISRVR